MDYPPPPSISRSTTPEREPCCNPPPNPWLAGSQGPQGPQGCVCDCECASKKVRSGIRYRSASPPRNITHSELQTYLDNRAVAFSNSAGRVQGALDAALISPSSYSGSVGVIFSQNAANAANANNLQNTVAPQAASVAAASMSIAATKAARLAYRSLCEATNVLNSVSTLSNTNLAPLVAKAKLAADALVVGSNLANVAAQAVYATASTISTNANTEVTNAKAALTQIECNAATASCNAVPGSTQAMVIKRQNMIDITTAQRKLDLLTIAATKALAAENAANAVAITTTNAYVGALEAQSTAVVANTPFVNATTAIAAAAAAFAAYQAVSNSDNLSTSYAANAAVTVANALLPGLQVLKDLVAATSAASALANTAAANARTLSASLDIEARNASAPLYNPVTSQMIAKQTAAAERFGAAAAAATARAARLSAAPPIPPPVQSTRAAQYSVHTPGFAQSASKKLVVNSVVYNAFK